MDDGFIIEKYYVISLTNVVYLFFKILFVTNHQKLSENSVILNFSHGHGLVESVSKLLYPSGNLKFFHNVIFKRGDCKIMIGKLDFILKFLFMLIILTNTKWLDIFFDI